MPGTSAGLTAASVPASVMEAVYRTKEILCDFSEKIFKMMSDEKDQKNLDHLKSIYNSIPVALYIIGSAIGLKHAEQKRGSN